jgi:hypothetical protein
VATPPAGAHLTITDGSVQQLLALLKVVGVSQRPYRARVVAGSRGAAALDFPATPGPLGELTVSWIVTNPHATVVAVEAMAEDHPGHVSDDR